MTPVGPFVVSWLRRNVPYPPKKWKTCQWHWHLILKAQIWTSVGSAVSYKMTPAGHLYGSSFWNYSHAFWPLTFGNQNPISCSLGQEALIMKMSSKLDEECVVRRTKKCCVYCGDYTESFWWLMCLKIAWAEIPNLQALYKITSSHYQSQVLFGYIERRPLFHFVEKCKT